MSPRKAQNGSRHPVPIGTFPLSWNGDILIKFRQPDSFWLWNRLNPGKQKGKTHEGMDKENKSDVSIGDEHVVMRTVVY